MTRTALLAKLTLSIMLVSSTPISNTTIAGKWNCITLTAIENGKESGTVRFNPGNVVYTYREDKTWQMDSNLGQGKAGMNGTFELHKNEMVLTKADGKVYKDFHLELKGKGNTLIMRDEGSLVTASRVDSTSANPTN